MTTSRSTANSRRYIESLEKIGRHADTAIVRVLGKGPRRFSEIEAGLATFGNDELDAGLRELDNGGIVTRRVDPGPPLRVLYELTSLGAELAPALRVVGAWAKRTEPEPA